MKFLYSHPSNDSVPRLAMRRDDVVSPTSYLLLRHLCIRNWAEVSLYARHHQLFQQVTICCYRSNKLEANLPLSVTSPQGK